MDWIHEDFEGPIQRVRALIEADLAEARGLGPGGALWDRAVDAVAAIARGPSRMVRPQLVLLGHLGAGGEVDAPDALVFAAGVELLHLFAVVHDDVMDHGTVRRGVPSVHRVIQRRLSDAGHRRGRAERAAHLAVVMGDLLHTRAIAMMARASGAPGVREALATIQRASGRAAVGQFLDLQGWDGPAAELSPRDFRAVLLNKGGHHSITAPLLAGWRLVDPAADLSDLEAWGDHVGLAFQGLDDLLDVLSGADELGKDSLQDLREGRLSLVSHMLREALGAAEWEVLSPSLGRGVMAPEDRIRLFQLLDRHQLIDRGLELVGEELDAASRRRVQLELPLDVSAGMARVEQRLRRYARALGSKPRPR